VIIIAIDEFDAQLTGEGGADQALAGT